MRKQWRERREAVKVEGKLHESHGTAVLLEKCYLLQIDPSSDAEYCAAVAKVRAEVPPVPPLRVIESSITLSRLHKQGALRNAPLRWLEEARWCDCT